MFVESINSMIKGIHLALEVKTSFGNSTPTTGYHLLHRKRDEKKHAHQKVTKQSLSDYAQQDWPIVTKQSHF
jgi:hypothetical protein